MRRHVQRVCRSRGDARVNLRSGKRKNRVVRIVEGMNNEMRRARMTRIALEHLQGDRGGLRLSTVATVAPANHAELRQRIEDCNLVIVRPALMHVGHIVGVVGVPLQLVVGRVVEDLHGGQERLFLFGRCFGQSPLERRCKTLQRGGRGGLVLLGPKRMVVTHRLAPVRQCEIRIDFLRILEGKPGLVELEAVQGFDACQECFLRLGRTGVWKSNAAEFVGEDAGTGHAGHGKQHDGASREGDNGHSASPVYGICSLGWNCRVAI